MAGQYRTPGVHIESAGERIQTLAAARTGVAAFLGSAQAGLTEPIRFDSFEAYQQLCGASDGPLPLAIRGFFENGGEDAWLIPVATAGLRLDPEDFLGTRAGRGPQGLRMLERLDGADLVCAPELAWACQRFPGFAAPSDVAAVQQELAALCERMHDRFALLDALPGMPLAEAVAWRRQFDSSHCALYYPWLKVRTGGEELVAVPPSGHVAGIYARADRQEGVHRSPANLPLEGVVDVERRLGKRERDHLFEHRVNGIHSFPGRGVRIWGARTLSSDPAFTQVNVRRLFILLRRSIETYAQWVVFEPNEPGLWKRLTRTIDGFLHDLWRRGALVGDTAEQAWYVKCDEETNPPEEREAGRLLVEIGVAPVKPTEFIVVRVQQWTREATAEAMADTAGSAAP